MGFSGGTYEEVGRWLWNFVTSHAKRVDPRIEVEVVHGDERQGKSYGVRLRRATHDSPLLEFDYADLAANRGGLAWCTALAGRVQTEARALCLQPTASASR